MTSLRLNPYAKKEVAKTVQLCTIWQKIAISSQILDVELPVQTMHNPTFMPAFCTAKAVTLLAILLRQCE